MMAVQHKQFKKIHVIVVWGEFFNTLCGVFFFFFWNDKLGILFYLFIFFVLLSLIERKKMLLRQNRLALASCRGIIVIKHF